MNIKKKKLKKFFLKESIQCPKIYNDYSDNNANKTTTNYFNKSFKGIIKNKSTLKKPIIEKDNKIICKDDIIKNNKTKNSIIYDDSFSFIDSNKSKNNNSNSILSNNKTSILTTNDKNTINFIINKFKKNKPATKILINNDKKMQLNSLSNLTKKNLKFLLDDEENETESRYKTSYKNNSKSLSKNISKVKQYLNDGNNSYLLSSKMMDLFNNRTSTFLNKSKSSLRMFSHNKIQFTADLINCFEKNVENSEGMIKKLRKKYNEAVEIYEKQKSLETQKALKDERDFYKLRNEEDLKISNNMYKKILNYNKRKEEDNRKSIIFPASRRKSLFTNNNLNRFSFNLINAIFTKNPNLLDDIDNENIKTNRNSSKFLDLLRLRKNIFTNKSEEKVYKAQKKYENFQKKKIKQNAKKFGDLIKDLIYSNYKLKLSRYLDDESKKIKIIHNDLVRLNKIKKINQNINSIEVDEFRSDYNKLKRKMKKCENEYYRVSVINNKYNLSYLKPILKTSTIKRYLSMKESNFGYP